VVKSLAAKVSEVFRRAVRGAGAPNAAIAVVSVAQRPNAMREDPLCIRQPNARHGATAFQGNWDLRTQQRYRRDIGVPKFCRMNRAPRRPCQNEFQAVTRDKAFGTAR